MPGAPSRTLVSETTQTAARRFELRLPALAASIAPELRGAIPELAAALPEADVTSLCVEILGAFLHGVRRGEPPGRAEHRVRSVDLARALAGGPASAVVEIVQHGQAAAVSAWEQELERMGLPAELRIAMSHRTDELTFGFADGLMQVMLGEYDLERRRRLEARESERARTVQALVTAEPSDELAASRAIGYDLSRTHTALVIWTPADSALSATRVRGTIDAVAGTVGTAVTPFTIRVDDACTWVWLGSDGAPGDTALGPLTREPFRTGGILVAIGEPAAGATGFRTSHADALRARAVVEAGARTREGIVRFRDVELASLALENPSGARRFVRGVLGGLAEDDEETGRLRETYATFLDCGASRVRAASRIGVHPNTVGSRVRRCRELLDPASADEPAQVRAALSLAELLRTVVLR